MTDTPHIPSAELAECPFCGIELEGILSPTQGKLRYQHALPNVDAAKCPASSFWAYEGSDELARWNRREALAARIVPSEGIMDLKWSHMPSYGSIDWSQLIEAVTEARIGGREHTDLLGLDFGPDAPHIGHQTAPQMNMNSLNRIVTAFVAAALAASPANVPPQVNEAVPVAWFHIPTGGVVDPLAKDLLCARFTKELGRDVSSEFEPLCRPETKSS